MQEKSASYLEHGLCRKRCDALEKKEGTRDSTTIPLQNKVRRTSSVACAAKGATHFQDKRKPADSMNNPLLK
jgi:hypothetical protein